MFTPWYKQSLFADYWLNYGIIMNHNWNCNCGCGCHSLPKPVETNVEERAGHDEGNISLEYLEFLRITQEHRKKRGKRLLGRT